MEFSTNSTNYLFSFDLKELLFLIHNQQKLHLNDYARVLYFNIIESLLMINEHKTLECIERIESEKDFLSISPHFPRLSGIFQSVQFIERIRKAALQFSQSSNFQFIMNDIQEAIDSLDEELKNKSTF